jgi:putative N6-adenine-specific DNA methylase
MQNDPFDLSGPHPLLVTCFRGITPYLEREVGFLELPVRDTHATGLETVGALPEAMRLCLCLRTALSVQMRLAAFTCRNGGDLYGTLRQMPWERLIPAESYFSIITRVETPSVDNSMYPSLKAKDAIVDRMQECHGRRPDTGPDRHRLVFNLYWKDETCRFYLNASGRKLSDRGYRKRPHKAPLREALAAAILMETGYDGSQPLVLPMCGSGTLAIEAALMAQRRAPGLLRDNYAFRHLADPMEEGYQAIRRDVREVATKETPAPIVATDRDPAAIEAARANAETAGVAHLIEFGICDYVETPVPAADGSIVLVNPPYGERLGEIQKLEGLYAGLGDWLKQSCAGATGFIFTGNRQLAKKVGLRPGRRVPFWNGKIECRLFAYELYAGSRER